MWKEGSLLVRGHVLHYWIKQYEFPSDYGIDEGRISKLTISMNGVNVVNYDRGWSLKPETEIAEIALAILLMEYN